MWNFDKIQRETAVYGTGTGCGLMWNFDKIQRRNVLTCSRHGCGLMWNFDKIQRSDWARRVATVVV